MKLSQAILRSAPIALIATLFSAQSTAQPIVLRDPRVVSNGDLQFEITGPEGNKRIEVSSDIKLWTTLQLVDSSVSVQTIPAFDRSTFVRVVTDETSSGDFPASVSLRSSTEIGIFWKPQPEVSTTRIYLAAEPTALLNAAGSAKLLATLPGIASAFVASNLAAGVDAFFGIELEQSTGKQMALVHGRTWGGPRAPLKSRVREVHGFAPNILCVTLSNGTTADLVSGWSVVRQNGVSIEITNVYRHSIPVSTGDYPLGWRCCGTDSVTEAVHRIFLVMNEAIGSSEILEISGPSSLHFILPFSDQYIETPVIQLNQVGYNPRAAKRFAYISGWMGDGGGLPLHLFPSQAQVLIETDHETLPRQSLSTTFQVTPRSLLDPMSGAPVHEIDLAALPHDESARYRIRLPGVGISWRTEVSEKAAFKAYYTVTRGLFHNRWGGDLRPDLTEWSRPPDHPFVFTSDSVEWAGTPDGNFPFQRTTPRVGRRAMSGGHHDAGDFDIRPFHTRVAQLLFRAYESETNAFGDSQLNLPESGNGIPDLLDEALWSILAWEHLQEDDGGVRLGVESYRHPYNQGILADQDFDDQAGDEPLPYWTYGRDATHTARCAGLFAQAARLVKPFDPIRSQTLEERALRAWGYATNHNAGLGSRLYPASELLRLTGNQLWHDQFDLVWRSLDSSDELVTHFLNAKPLNPSDFFLPNRYDPDYVVAYLTSVQGETKVELLRNTFYYGALVSIQFGENENREAHRTPHPWGYSVGFGQSTSLGNYFWFLYSALQLNLLNEEEKQSAFDSLSLAADYILGGNPNGLVYVTGLGSRKIEEPLHLDSLAFIKRGLGPMPGIPVYGPVDGRENQGYAAKVMAAFYPEVGDDESGYDHLKPAVSGHPVGRRHADTRLWVNANEFSVAEMQAPAAQLFAALMRGTTNTLPPLSYKPGQPDHRNPLP